MQKWEYKVVMELDEAALNALGNEGWDLISVIISRYGSLVYYFKRAKA